MIKQKILQQENCDVATCGLLSKQAPA